MTPTELDAIFRAWRDELFKSRPGAQLYANTKEGFVDDIWPYTEDASSDTARHILAYGLRYGLITRALPGLRCEILICREEEEPVCAFPDPAPLPAGVPIPFPAGKALYNQLAYKSVAARPKAFQDPLRSRIPCVKHEPEWEWDCNDCTWL